MAGTLSWTRSCSRAVLIFPQGTVLCPQTSAVVLVPVEVTLRGTVSLWGTGAALCFLSGSVISPLPPLPLARRQHSQGSPCCGLHQPLSFSQRPSPRHSLQQRERPRLTAPERERAEDVGISESCSFCVTAPSSASFLPKLTVTVGRGVRRCLHHVA